MGTPTEYDYFNMSETPVDLRGGFNTEPYAEYCGLPWGGKFCVGTPGPDDDDSYGNPYEAHYQK